jgi:hypothetical protein
MKQGSSASRRMVLKTRKAKKERGERERGERERGGGGGGKRRGNKKKQEENGTEKGKKRLGPSPHVQKVTLFYALGSTLFHS